MDSLAHAGRQVFDSPTGVANSFGASSFCRNRKQTGYATKTQDYRIFINTNPNQIPDQHGLPFENQFFRYCWRMRFGQIENDFQDRGKF